MRVPRIQGPRRVAAADFAQVCLQIGNKPKAAPKKKNFMMFLMKLKFFNTFVAPNHGVFPAMAIDGTPPRQPRRSAWDRSMLLLFRISSGSGTSAALQGVLHCQNWLMSFQD